MSEGPFVSLAEIERQNGIWNILYRADLVFGRACVKKAKPYRPQGYFGAQLIPQLLVNHVDITKYEWKNKFTTQNN